MDLVDLGHNGFCLSFYGDNDDVPFSNKLKFFLELHSVKMDFLDVAVVGSRTFTDYDLLEKELDKIHAKTPIGCIHSGGAMGADTLAERWAKVHLIPVQVYVPDWKRYGRWAGLLRNKDIVEGTDVVVAFWDGKSKGTLNSIGLARKSGKKLIVVEF